MRHSNKERDNVAESRPGSNTDIMCRPYTHTLHRMKCNTNIHHIDTRTCIDPLSNNVGTVSYLSRLFFLPVGH